MCTSVYVCVRVKARSTSGVFFSHSPPYFWDKVFHWTRSFMICLNEVISKLQGFSCLPLFGTQLPTWYRNPNPDPHVRTASTSQQSHLSLLYDFKAIKMYNLYIWPWVLPIHKTVSTPSLFWKHVQIYSVFADSCILLVQGVFSRCKLSLLINPLSLLKENVPCETRFRPACYGAM